MRLFSTSRYFTLIELLIVVAIIAILAAIAVPNFLEAQTRAKVSRAKSDMRSIATALEAYRVDHPRYPPAYNPNAPGVNLPLNPRIRRLVPLTTPVSYITSVPLDVFSREVAASTTYATDDSQVRAFIYIDRQSYGENVASAFGIASNGDNLYRILFREQFSSGVWLLRSRGPRGGIGPDSEVGNSVDKTDSYDATNGTVSRGNIMMMGSGIGFLDDK